jgi:microcystin-dependent protein
VVILGQLAQLMAKICPHSVGDVIFRATATSPQTDYPGTTWVKLPADVMIRTANMAASNILQTGGRDSVTLSINEMPAHSHDLQAYPSNTALDGGTSNRRSVDVGNSQLDSQVIKSAGGGQAFSILNSHITVVGWRRTA